MCRRVFAGTRAYWRARRSSLGVMKTVLGVVLFAASLVIADSSMALLVDPTRPLLEPVRPREPAPRLRDEPREYEVQSILVRRDRRLAVVNGQRVRVGDVVDGARVMQIGPGRVLLAVDGEVHEVRLNPRDIKVPAAESMDGDV